MSPLHALDKSEGQKDKDNQAFSDSNNFYRGWNENGTEDLISFDAPNTWEDRGSIWLPLDRFILPLWEHIEYHVMHQQTL